MPHLLHAGLVGMLTYPRFSVSKDLFFTEWYWSSKHATTVWWGIHFSAQQILPLCVPKQMVLPEFATPLCRAQTAPQLFHTAKKKKRARDCFNEAFCFTSQCVHHFLKTSESASRWGEIATVYGSSVSCRTPDTSKITSQLRLVQHASRTFCWMKLT